MRKPKVEAARNYAILHHAEQMFGEQPYSYHLDMVHAIVVKYNLGEEYEIAAYLHDLLEDTNIKKQELTNMYGKDIGEMVFAVSGFGSDRKEKQADIKRKMPLYVRSINLKMCDRLANLLSSKINKPKLYQRYCLEHEDSELQFIFSQGNSALFNAIENALERKQSIKVKSRC
jgi:(p)ppGpp synthase/HD superfamily hydrolase